MRKPFLSLFATIFVSTVAVAAAGDSPTPPVSDQAIPSAYVWLSGRSAAIGIGYTLGPRALYCSKGQKQYKFKLSGVSIADAGAPPLRLRERFTIRPVRLTSAEPTV
jgi:hypothetical protein